MCATVALALSLALLLTVSAAEPNVDAPLSQTDLESIRKLIASITADPIASINSVVSDKQIDGAVPKEAINISRDGTQSPITIYLRTDLVSVLTSDKNHVLTEYNVRKGAQGWALDIKRYSWSDYPKACLAYFFLGLIVHLAFFVAGCVCLIFARFYARSGYWALAGGWALFNMVFFLVAAAVNGFWSCLIFGHFYTSSDYVSDFSPLIPVTEGVISARFGNQVGHLYGISLRQLQLLWMAFAAITWILALCIYFRIRRLSWGPTHQPNQSPEPAIGGGSASSH